MMNGFQKLWRAIVWTVFGSILLMSLVQLFVKKTGPIDIDVSGLSSLVPVVPTQLPYPTQIPFPTAAPAPAPQIIIVERGSDEASKQLGGIANRLMDERGQMDPYMIFAFVLLGVAVALIGGLIWYQIYQRRYSQQSQISISAPPSQTREALPALPAGYVWVNREGINMALPIPPGQRGHNPALPPGPLPPAQQDTRRLKGGQK